MSDAAITDPTDEAAASRGAADLVFVVGASRSGTTMLATTLGLHSSMHTLQETHFFGDVTDLANGDRQLGDDEALRILAGLVARQYRGFFTEDVLEEDYERAGELMAGQDRWPASKLFSRFAIGAADEAGKSIPVEQTPRNIYYARALLEAYPDARVLEILRDPRAVLYSQRKRWSIRFRNRGIIPLRQVMRVYFNYHAVTMSTLWKTAARAGLAMQEHPRFKTVHYESLVAEPEETLRDICHFLGLDYEEQMLEAPHTTSSTRAVDGARGFYTSSIDEWVETLPRGDRAISEAMSRDIAARRGYCWDAPGWRLLLSLGHMIRYPLHIVGSVLLNPRRLMIQLRSILRPSQQRGQ